MNPDSTSELIFIPLTRGYFTIVDAVDADLAQFKWHAAKAPNYAGGGAFYAARSITVNHKSKGLSMHKVVLSRILGRDLIKGELPDHIYGNPLNNCRYNLRVVTASQNAINTGLRSSNKSGYKGVVWHKATQKWVAVIGINNKHIHLGCFKTPEEAYAAYCAAALKYHGEFANL